MNPIPEFAPIRQALLDKIAAGQLPSMAIGVVRQGAVLWDEALGWADRERGILATPETIYPIASVSKSITATGLRLLAERGQMDLDAPLMHYLEADRFPASPHPPGSATVNQVANMAAGIPHLWQYEYADDPEGARTTADLVRGHAFLAAPPGKFHQYSNLAYGVLELVIAQAAGKPFGEFMRAELFDPLGMPHTSLKDGLPTGTAQSTASIATAYDAENHPVAWDYRLRPDGGAGFYTSSRDLLRYGQFHLGQLAGKLPLSPTAVQALHHPPDPQAACYRINPIARYAMGWGIVEDGQYTSLWSNGAMLGCSAMLLLVPAEGIGVVCLSNYTSPDSISDQTAIQVAGALLPGFAENLQVRMEEVETAERQAGPDLGFYGAWRGAIAVPDGEIALELDIAAPDEVRVRLDGQPEVSLPEAVLAKDTLTGQAGCSLPFELTYDQPHLLAFELRLDGDRLTGVARAESSLGRPFFGLPFYTALARKPA